MQFDITVKDEQDEIYTVVADPLPTPHRPLREVPRAPTDGYRFYLTEGEGNFVRFVEPDKFISIRGKKIYRVASQEGLNTLANLPSPG